MLERWSDSSSSYVLLDSSNATVYKQLYRAAKAKLKLRVRATVQKPEPPAAAPVAVPQPLPVLEHLPGTDPRSTYMNTVLTATEDRDGVAGSSLPQKEAVGDPLLPISAPLTEKEIANSVARRQRSHHCELISTLHNQYLAIQCDNCDGFILNEHYHCNTCNDGSFDLCLECVNNGVACKVPCHWLIKRAVTACGSINRNSVIVPQQESEQQKVVCQSPPAMVRTCNACFKGESILSGRGSDTDCSEFDERQMVVCKNCADYDLCYSCLSGNEHGHNPAHEFAIIYDDKLGGKKPLQTLCLPGRGQLHAALCDGCNMVKFPTRTIMFLTDFFQRIYGVRYKCFTCPDWDYCSDCYKNASTTHAGHRFAPLYEPCAQRDNVSAAAEIHDGVFCNGPLCSLGTLDYITGIRYKCTVCDEIDFCEACEAHPANKHDITHPLIKFRTPVSDVSVTTLNEVGGHTERLGDNRIMKSVSTETVGPSISHASTQVRDKEAAFKAMDAPEPVPSVTPLPVKSQDDEFHAIYINETVRDGYLVEAGQVFTQTWTLFNPGPSAWPKGSAVRFVAGEPMFDVDAPTSVQQLHSVMSSDVLAAPVYPFHTAQFSVTLKAPGRQGAAAAYFRLKLPDGSSIGQYLWCSINVCVASVSEPEREPVGEQEDGTSEVPIELEAAKKSVSAVIEAPAEAEASVEVEAPEAIEPLEGSDMVFPRLDKESSASSTTLPNERMESPKPDKAVEDDMKSLTLENEGDTLSEEFDDGLLTDEEYDILDASDEEFADAQMKGN